MKAAVAAEVSLSDNNNLILNRGLRKRNVSVNWDSPIKQVHCEIHQPLNAEAVQPVAILPEGGVNELEREDEEEEENVQLPTVKGDDDGFESLNGKSSSGEEQPEQVIRIRDIIEEDEDNSSNQMPPGGCCQAQQARPRAKATNKPIKRGSNKRDSSDTDGDGECDEDHLLLSSPAARNSGSGAVTEGGTTSTAEWCGITTNSDDCSYTSS